MTHHRTQHREIVTAQDITPPIGPYSHAVRAGGLLFCSGQIPMNAAGELVGESVGEQARQCLENLEAVAREAGVTLADSVRLTIYLTDMTKFAEVNDVYGGFFETEPPARVTIGVAALPKGANVEMDAVIAC